MSDRYNAKIEGPYVIEDFGKQGGDPFIRVDQGRICFLADGPGRNKLRVGDQVYIRFRPGRGNVDFAYFEGTTPPDGLVDAVAPTDSGLERDVYLLLIGPSAQRDQCAIAVCSDGMLDMKPYDALVYAIEHHDDPDIFTESTDRRIAGGLFSTYDAAKADNALDELVFTLENRPVTRSTPGPLKQYFTVESDDGYTAGAAMKRQKKAPEPPPKRDKKPRVAQSGVHRKGRPG